VTFVTYIFMDYPMKFYRNCLASDELNPKKRGFVTSPLMQVYTPIKDSLSPS